MARKDRSNSCKLQASLRRRTAQWGLRAFSQRAHSAMSSMPAGAVRAARSLRPLKKCLMPGRSS
eukprot:6187089-Pleurochrysis_carterae.AAC.2